MVELRTLGELQLLSSGEPVRFSRVRESALLVYVACAGSGSLLRAELAAMFWPQASGRHALHSLSQALYRLTCAIPGLSFRADQKFIAVERGKVAVDLLRFREELRAGRYAEARALYGGPFLDKLNFDDVPDVQFWLEQTRREVALSAEDMFRALLEQSEGTCEWLAAEDLARELLSLNPYDEMAAAVEVEALAASGKRARARERLAAIRTLLQSVGRAPSRRVVDLDQALAAGASADLMSSSDLTLVGRDVEFEALKRQLGRAQAGHGGALVVTGKAGIGKSRLIRQLQRLGAIRGFRSLLATGAPLLREVAHAGTRELLSGLPEAELRRLAGGWADVLTGIVGPPISRADRGEPPPRDRLYQAVAMLIVACARESPLLIVVEDVQWLDESTVDLLRFLVRRIGEARTLVVGTARPDEVTGGSRVAFLRALEGVPLGELAREAAHDLIQAFCRRVGKHISREQSERVGRRSAGHPFFLLELLSAWNDSVSGTERVLPGSVEQFLADRLSAMSPNARVCAQALSVLGGSASAELIAAVAGRSLAEAADAVEDLVRSGWVRESEQLEFIHDLVREAAYAGMTNTRRQFFHTRAARALRSRPRLDVCALAEHSHLAGAHELAFRYSMAAAKVMLRRVGYAAAEPYWRRAVAHAPNRADRVRALERLADCAYTVQNTLEADRLYAELLQDALTSPAIRLICRARRLSLRARLGQVSNAEAACCALVKDAECLGNPAAHIVVADAISVVIGTIDPRLFTEYSQYLRAVAEDPRYAEDKVRLLQLLAQLSLYLADGVETDRYVQIATESAANSGPDRRAAIHALRGTLRFVRGDLMGAEGEYSEAALLLDGERSRFSASDRCNYAVLDVERGRFDLAEQELLDSAAWAEAAESRYNSIIAQSNLAWLHYERGQLERAIADAQRLLADVNRPVPAGIGVLALGVLALASMSHDPVAAEQCRKRLLEREDGPIGMDSSYAEVFLARMDEAEGQRQLALHRIERAIGREDGRDFFCHARLELEKARLLGIEDAEAGLALAREVRARALEAQAVLLLNKAEALIRKLRAGGAIGGRRVPYAH